MDADDFQEIYKLLRGSRSAMAVLDARALFLDQKMSEAYDKLTYARETFLETRSRLLNQDVEKQVDPKAKDAARQVKKLKRKQEKLQDVLEAFDELLPGLEKSANREKARKAKEAEDVRARAEDDSAVVSGEGRVARPAEIGEDFIRGFVDSSGDQRLAVISGRFGFREVQSEQDIYGDTLYFIQFSDNSYLVRTPASEEMSEHIKLVSVVDARPFKPFSREAFVKLGTDRKMVMLTHREEACEADIDVTDGDDEDAERPRSTELLADGEEQSVLDMGAFGQLLTAAQRSGLLAGADQIAHVRDREFRMGKYDLAFQAIDAMFSRFTASSIQRLQHLTREDAEIAAGRIKMSPKDVQAKRARDRKQTQEIDRAQRRFQVVLEGLRVLMKTT